MASALEHITVAHEEWLALKRVEQAAAESYSTSGRKQSVTTLGGKPSLSGLGGSSSMIRSSLTNFSIRASLMKSVHSSPDVRSSQTGDASPRRHFAARLVGARSSGCILSSSTAASALNGPSTVGEVSLPFAVRHTVHLASAQMACGDANWAAELDSLLDDWYDDPDELDDQATPRLRSSTVAAYGRNSVGEADVARRSSVGEPNSASRNSIGEARVDTPRTPRLHAVGLAVMAGSRMRALSSASTCGGSGGGGGGGGGGCTVTSYAPAEGRVLSQHLAAEGVPHVVLKLLMWKQEGLMNKTKRLVVIAGDSETPQAALKLLWFASQGAAPRSSVAAGSSDGDAHAPPRSGEPLLRLCNWRNLFQPGVEVEMIDVDAISERDDGMRIDELRNGEPSDGLGLASQPRLRLKSPGGVAEEGPNHKRQQMYHRQEWLFSLDVSLFESRRGGRPRKYTPETCLMAAVHALGQGVRRAQRIVAEREDDIGLHRRHGLHGLHKGSIMPSGTRKASGVAHGVQKRSAWSSNGALMSSDARSSRVRASSTATRRPRAHTDGALYRGSRGGT